MICQKVYEVKTKKTYGTKMKIEEKRIKLRLERLNQNWKKKFYVKSSELR
jgi:hypothetical protein